jgi:hypothetical protein
VAPPDFFLFLCHDYYDRIHKCVESISIYYNNGLEDGNYIDRTRKGV